MHTSGCILEFMSVFCRSMYLCVRSCGLLINRCELLFCHHLAICSDRLYIAGHLIFNLYSFDGLLGILGTLVTFDSLPNPKFKWSQRMNISAWNQPCAHAKKGANLLREGGIEWTLRLHCCGTLHCRGGFWWQRCAVSGTSFALALKQVLRPVVLHNT